jgi:DNA-directed RNA polymerase sigma subunit (sigma70/sigma32)
MFVEHRDVLLDDPIGTISGSAAGRPSDETHKDLLPGEDDPEENALRSITRKQINETLERCAPHLGKLGQTIVRDRLLQEEQTLEEIGEDFQLCRERVRQVEVDVRQYLKNKLAAFNETPEEPPRRIRRDRKARV